MRWMRWFQKKKFVQRRQVIIGVMGAGSGVGTTHTALLFSTYLSGCGLFQTAFVELNDSQDIRRLLHTTRKHYGIRYFPSASSGQLWKLKEGGYERIVVDFGHGGNREEFLRCDIRVVCVALSSWKGEECLQILRMEDEKILNRFHFVMAFGSEKERKRLERGYHFQIHRLPFVEDPLLISKASYEVLKEMEWLNLE